MTRNASGPAHAGGRPVNDVADTLIVAGADIKMAKIHNRMP
jgi:hypothetical protein